MTTPYNKCNSYFSAIKIIMVLFASQIILVAQNKEVLTIDEYIKQVKLYHPVISKSNLIVDQSYAQRLAAKAQFDPQINIESDRKDINQSTYYNYQKYGVELATQSPISIKAGHDKANGSFINPEFTNGGVTYLGIEVPLLSGFLMDQRRAALAQAKLFVSQSKAAKLVMINDLLLNAHIAYWEWAAAFSQAEILVKITENAKQRLELMKSLNENGERSIADTIEAAVQLDNFKLQSQEAKMELVNQTLNLSNYLWSKGNIAYIIDEKYIPDTIAFQFLINANELMLADVSIKGNPSLQLYDFKLSALQIDRKLKKQYLLPKFDIKASLLRRDADFPLRAENFELNDNFKLGFSFKYPLFTRSAKAQLQENKIKTNMVQLDLDQQKWEYTMKLRSLLNEYGVLKNQLTTVNDIIFKNTVLRDLENLKLSIGESTLFLINNRETKMVESFNKKVELSLKLHKTEAKIKWVSGTWVKE